MHQLRGVWEFGGSGQYSTTFALRFALSSIRDPYRSFGNQIDACVTSFCASMIWHVTGVGLDHLTQSLPRQCPS